jgi:hypothetical protein
MEAMACLCPVLLSHIPPHCELAPQVDFIPLIGPDDRERFRCEIKRFSKISTLERTRIGEKYRSLVEKQFSLSTMHKDYMAIYEVTDNHVAPILEVVT